jgi:arylsulfatase A-like enzyme/Flp pilus assembly protein TadD
MTSRKLIKPCLCVFLPLLVVVGAGGVALHLLSSPAKQHNVILISIDTCRADRLSCYGFTRNTTPYIDAVARDGFLFKDAIAPVPLTLPSHCSMMTGTIPPHHGVHDNIYYRLAESNITLAEILKNNGYTTGAVVGAFMMDPKFGLAQGFDTYDARFERDRESAEFLSERRAEDVSRVAKAWLDANAQQRLFLFIHYFDPHFPYAPPKPFSTTFAEDTYAGEIAYVDRCIGEVMDHLKGLGLYDSALIIITSDHGESLMEHEEDTHGWFIYHSTTRIPLIVKLPGRRNGKTVPGKVALIDLAPTALELVGIPVPADMEGESLTAYFGRGKHRKEERYIYSESLLPTRFACSSVLGLETREWKYIQSSKPEMYDLLQDPREAVNLFGEKGEQAGFLRDRLKALLEDRTRTRDDETTLALDRDSLSRLEGLGYIGGRHGDFEFETGKQDPKEFLPFYLKLIRAMDLMRRSPKTLVAAPAAGGGSVMVPRFVLAGQLCREILAERPDVIKAHAILGRLAVEAGDLDEAGARYSAILGIDPNNAEASNDLGNVRMTQGRLDEAASLYKEAVRLARGVDEHDANVDRALARLGRADPVLRNAQLGLGDVLYRQGRTAEAAKEYREALGDGPGDARAHFVIGLDLAAQGRHQDAVEAYRQALALNPRYEEARRALAAAIAKQKTDESP